MNPIRGNVLAALWSCGVLATGSYAAEFECVIQPRQVIEVRSPIEGLLERIAVDRGATVKKGQELAFVDSSVERVLADAAKYRSEMEGASRAGQSKVQLSGRRLGRAQELFRQQFIAEQAQDDALHEKQLAEAELQEARDNRRLAEIEYQRQLKLIQLKTVRSPIDGVVMERILNVGELAEAGVGRKPILRLAEIETLYVEALLPAQAYGQIKMGMVADVMPATTDGRAERATVKVIDRVLDAGSGTFGVRLELPNKELRLLAGVRCKVNFAQVNLPGAGSRPLEGSSQAPRPNVASPVPAVNRVLPAPAPAPAVVPPPPPPSPMTPVTSSMPASNVCDKLQPAVVAWANAWSRKDLDAYFASYGDSFVPANGGTRTEWAQQRRTRIGRQNDASIELKDFRPLRCDANSAEVVFTQSYMSADYKDVVQKTLGLEITKGAWRITREAVSPTNPR